MSKLVSAFGLLVGGAAAIFELLVAFGVNLSPDQQTAIAAVAALALSALSVWFHPAAAARRGE